MRTFTALLCPLFLFSAGCPAAGQGPTLQDMDGPALLAELRSGVEERTTAAAHELARRGKGEVPGLIASLADERYVVRSSSAWVLGNLGADAREAVPALCDALWDTDVYMRAQVASSLGLIGSAAAIPALTEVADAGGAVGEKAGESLAKIEALGDEARRRAVGVPAPAKTLRELGADLLDPAGPRAATIQAIARFLFHRNHSRRRDAAKLVQELGADADAVVAELEATLRDSQAERRALAAAALGNLGACASRSLPRLVEAAADPSSEVRSQAVYALLLLGPTPEHVPVLTAALADGDEEVRWRAAKALGELGPPARPAVAALLKLIGPRKVGPRGSTDGMWAATALGKIGAEPELVVPALIAHLKLDDGTGAGAAEALGAFGPRAAQAVPALIPYTEPRENIGLVREPAIKALGLIGPAAVDAAPALTRCLEDPDHDLRDLAERSLRQIRGEAVGD